MGIRLEKGCLPPLYGTCMCTHTCTSVFFFSVHDNGYMVDGGIAVVAGLLCVSTK